MGPVTQILSYLSSIGLSLKMVGLKRFEFGSCVITNVGSVGIENSFAPMKLDAIAITNHNLFDKKLCSYHYHK